MLEILENLISILTGDTTLTAIVPTNNILTGQIDIITESNSALLYPMLNLSIVSEVSRTVPLNTRDTVVQIDIFSNNSMLEILSIYERVVFLLNYYSGDKGSAHIFWQRLGGVSDQFESDRGLWHRAISYNVWTIK